MRFDDPGYLETWRLKKVYPRIHDAIFGAFMSHARGTAVLDLGCSHGLLAERLIHFGGAFHAVGVDADEKAIERGVAAGIQATLIPLRLTDATLCRLTGLIKDHGLNVVIARRILPELFGDDPTFGRRFAEEIAAAGIAELFLEGRVASGRSVNPLRSIAEEVELVSGSYREVIRAGAVSFLVAR